MTGLERYVGQVLDEKYRLERLLGLGGYRVKVLDFGIAKLAETDAGDTEAAAAAEAAGALATSAVQAAAAAHAARNSLEGAHQTQPPAPDADLAADTLLYTASRSEQ